MGPGYEGTAENYSVIRFTLPAGASGIYRLQTAVKSVLEGDLSTDADFHVTKNGVELFGLNVPANSAAGYTNVMQLSAGDTVDFVTGRGDDDRVQGSGLKIKAFVTLLDANAAPTARIALSPTILFRENDRVQYVVSGNQSDAPIVLDGRSSSDADGDALTFAWFVHGEATPFATGDVTEQTADLGAHTVDLAVSDGVASGEATVTFEVITAADAIAQISSVLDDAGLSRGLLRPLQSALETALRSLERGNYSKAIEQLQSFEWKVQSQLAPVDAALAQRLINATEQVINALVVANPN